MKFSGYFALSFKFICRFSLKNKLVTKYKDYLITGWKGEFEIRGDAEVLDFLYQVGLGEKNSMGFGMFVIEE